VGTGTHTFGRFNHSLTTPHAWVMSSGRSRVGRDYTGTMANADMAEYWNGRPAEFWVTEAERFDSMLAAFGNRLLTAAALEPGERVLDVGCGNAPSVARRPAP